MTTVSGILRDTQKNPLPGLDVTVRYTKPLAGFDDGAAVQTDRFFETDLNGLLTMYDLVPGHYRFVVFVPSNEATTLTVPREATMTVQDVPTMTLEEALDEPFFVSLIASAAIGAAAQSAASANLAQAWAESPTPPDPDDATSKSSKTWAGVAQEAFDGAQDLANSISPGLFKSITEFTGDGTAGPIILDADPVNVNNISVRVDTVYPFRPGDLILNGRELSLGNGLVFPDGSDCIVESLAIIGSDWITTVEENDFALPMADKDGFVRAGLGNDGTFFVEGLIAGSGGGGTARLASAEIEEFEFFFADQDGFIVAGMDETGGGLGSETGASFDPHNVQYMFTEPFSDPSQSLVLTWVSDSANGDLAEYRAKGAGSWTGVKSQRTRKMGPLDWWLHSVAIEGLAFANVYEARFPGSDFSDDFRTTPRKNPVIAAGSDFQSTQIVTAPQLRLLAESIRAQGADIFLHPGDHVNDDGRKAPVFEDDEQYWERWFEYMQTLSQILRKNDAIIPLAGLVGNHEARKANPSNDPADAEVNGSEQDGADGTIGQISDVLSWSYWDATPTKFVDSAGTLSFGEDVFVIGLNTDHSEDLEPQIDWLIDQLEAAYPKYRHLVVMGHYPAFYPAEGARHTTQPARRLRNLMYPSLEQFADKLRVYLCGHAHVFAITPPLRVLYDDALTPEQNDERYTEDAALGVVQIGTGPLQVRPRFPERGDDVSDFDGSNMFRAAMGWNEENEVVTRGSEAIDNQTIDTVWHYWLLNFSDTQFQARGFGQHNLPFFTYTKEV